MSSFNNLKQEEIFFQYYSQKYKCKCLDITKETFFLLQLHELQNFGIIRNINIINVFKYLKFLKIKIS